MREIKFRAHFPNRGFAERVTVYEEGSWDADFGEVCGFGEDDGGRLSQFTGFRDKNDKDVYEGDIIKVRHFYDMFDKEGFDVFLRVGWSEIECGWRGFAYLEDASKKSSGCKITECEIIGNILENPELLEKNKLTNEQ